METVSVEKYGMPARAENHHATLFKVTDGLERNIRLGDLSHGDGGLHAGGLPLLLQKVL